MFRSLPAYFVLNPTPAIWEFDTRADCTLAGVPISTDTVYAGMQIDWGDGSVTTVTSDMTVSEAYTHEYAEAGQYHIVVSYYDWESVELSLNTVGESAASPIAEALHSIEKIYAIPKVANTSFAWLFHSYIDLLEVVDDIFANNPQIITFLGTFYSCTSLSTIPASLFASNTLATNFRMTFSCCYNLRAVPDGLFDSNTQATDFYGIFQSCDSLTSIPSGLFANNINIEIFDTVFMGAPLDANKECDDGTPYLYLEICSEKVTSFGDLFEFWTPNVASVDTFYVSVPEGSQTETAALAYNDMRRDAQLTLNTDPCPVTWEFDTVENCLVVGVPISYTTAYTGMTIDWGDGNVTTVASVDDYVHVYDTAGQYHITVTYDDWANVELYASDARLISPFQEAREGIAKVYKIPQVANTSFAYLFYEYNQLTAIEDGLFDNNTQITNFAYAFYNCYQMTTIPEQLFASHTLVTDFTQTFRDSGRIDNQTLYIGSEVVTSADMFMYETASYGNLNTVYVPANSTTETTFNSAMNIGCTVATYTP